jgi:hypothetical protein
MSYIERLLRKNRPIPLPGTDKTDETPPRKTGDMSQEVPTKPTKPGFVSFVGTQQGDIPDFSPSLPPWPPRPAELARWPLAWRQRWGLLANELESQGWPFPECERRAFDRVRAERQAS